MRTGDVADSLVRALQETCSPITARTILGSALRQAGLTPESLDRGALDASLVGHLLRGVRLYARDHQAFERCRERLEGLVTTLREALSPETLRVVTEDDVVTARHRARVFATSVGFDGTTQMKLATVVSELARNMVRYAGGGLVRLVPLTNPRRGLRVEAEDTGPGIADLDRILAGAYRSKTGLGLGLLGCKRLVDEFEVKSELGRGTRVRAEKYLT